MAAMQLLTERREGADSSLRTGLASESIRRATLLTLASAAIVLVLYFVVTDFLNSLTAEDGLVEYLTTLGYLVGAVVFAVLAWRSNGLQRWWFVLLAVGFFLIAGEEVSWGQRLFGISTPEELERNNVQQELTLHNIEGVQSNVRLLGVLIFTCLYLALPFLVPRSGGVRRLVERLRFPVPPLSCAPVALVGLAFMVIPRLDGSVVFSLDEIGELYMAAAAAVFAVAIWQRITASEPS
jgi:hypothetical protein